MIARAALAVVWLLHWLPLPVLARIGELFGGVLYVLARTRRRICERNIERCLPELGGPARVALARAHFRILGRSILERALFWWASRARLERITHVIGREWLGAADSPPVIVFAPHFVGLDAFPVLALQRTLTGMYSNQSSRVWNQAMLRGRTRFGGDAFSRQDGIRPVLRAMRKGAACYYLPDMDFGARDAIFVPFFGVPAATVLGLPRLARLAGAKVVPCVSRILPGGGGYELRFYPAWENYPSGDDAADVRRMNAFIEERVREMPEQYHWTHRRFKTRPAGEPGFYGPEAG